MKKSIFILLLFFSLCIFTSVQGLEVDYPDIPGTSPLPDKPLLPEYVKYLYNLSIMLAGLVAFFSLVYGGFRYLTSVGSPVAMSDAKEQITAGIVGLVILLISYTILSTINPELKFLRAELPHLGKGIILYASSGCPGGEDPDGRPGEDFMYLGKSMSFLGDFTNKAKSIYFLNAAEGNEALKLSIFPKENWEPEDSPSWESEDHSIGTCKSIPDGTQTTSVFLKWQREPFPDITTTTTWYELPTGTLIEELLEINRLNRIKTLAAQAENLSKNVRDRARELNNALASCRCSETSPIPATCGPSPFLICFPPGPVCTGDPCPNRDEINQKRGELRAAYTELRNWLYEGELYRVGAQFKKDLARLYIAKILLDAGQVPLTYDNFLEFKQVALESEGEATIEAFQLLGEVTRGRGDSSTMYFDAEASEQELKDVLFYLEAEAGMLSVIGDLGWTGTSFPFVPGQQILTWPTSETGSYLSGWYDTYNTTYYAGGCHRAIDIAAGTGDPVRAVREGVVHKIEDLDGRSLGLYITLQHEYGGVTFYTVYAHLGGIGSGISIGGNVGPGQVIGFVDNTGASEGSHLHFALQTGDAPRGVAYDPLLYLPPASSSGIDDTRPAAWPRKPDVCFPPAPPFALVPTTTGSCAVNDLVDHFGEYAAAASCICDGESKGDVFALNDGCLAGLTCEWSVGLFQLNIVYECPAGLTPPRPTSGQCVADPSPGCRIIDQSALNACMANWGWGNADKNEQEAWLKFDAVGRHWHPTWSTAQGCGLQ
ncbi:peptidoglycan DD-metalloendopeptidase family protein [Patescibacteria group bacterium]